MPAAPTGTRALGHLLSGASWLAVQFVLQIVLSLWSVRLIVEALGPDRAGAYRFATGFAVFQFLFEFGAGSALQRQLADAWARGDRAGVDRGIACGMNVYAATAAVQAAALLGVAHLAVPHAEFDAESRRLVVRLLWLQAASAPVLGLAAVGSCMLQAARRYELVARCELAITLLRFAALVAGVRAGVDFFWVAAAQTAAIVIPRAGPALWVMVRELGYVPHFRGAGWADYLALGRFSLYVAMIQVGSILADRLDAAVLGFVLARPGPPIAVYDVVSKPYLLLSQAGIMLTSMVLPAVASLSAADDRRGLDRVKYDGSRLHIGVLLPVGLLAWIYAGPFLSLWIGARLGGNAAAVAPLMRLFLVAAIPLVLGVPVQMAIGLGRVRAIAAAALAGSLANLALSTYLASRLGVSGVIWGTVLTTMVSNLLVPGLVVRRALAIDARTYLVRALGAPAAGAAVMIAATRALQASLPVAPLAASPRARLLLLVLHLGAGMLAYVVGYASVPHGRRDLALPAAGLRRRIGRDRSGSPGDRRTVEDRAYRATRPAPPPGDEAPASE
jgi:O-antigen/teichoic acid export membrane protein